MDISQMIAAELRSRPLTAAGTSWKWQLRDASGQWIEMGSTVSWAARGQIRTGKIIGSPEPGRAQVKDDKNGVVAVFAERELTATMEMSTAKKTHKTDPWYNEAMREVKEPKAVDVRALAVKTDTALGKLYDKEWGVRMQMQQYAQSIHSWSGSKKVDRRGNWDRPLSEALTNFIQPKASYSKRDWERMVETYHGLERQLQAIKDEQAPLEEVYRKYHWTRAFLVLNGNGHVHSSRSCSTCYPTTQFGWLPEYSGANEVQIVEDAGERACTVCYPSAPVDVLSRPSKIFSPDERQKMADREARAAAKVERERKRIEKAATKDGSELVIYPDGRSQTESHVRGTRPERFTSEISATTWYTDQLVTQVSNPEYWARERENREAAMLEIATSLAEKHEISVEEMQARLAKKGEAKVKKYQKEVALWR